MYKTILLTVDLNHDASWTTALPTAVDLAKANGAALHLISVVPDFGVALVSGYFPDDFKEKALNAAEAALEKLIADHVPADVKATPHLGYGTVHDEVLAAIDKIGADLVVMGSHAPDRVREFLVGSQADRVVRRSPVSVLVVRG